MLRLTPTLCAISLAVFACGETDRSELTLTTTTGPIDDGRFHPEPNGEHTSETEACETLYNAFTDRQLALKCVVTVHQCPAFLRSVYTTACMQYDLGTVTACAEFIGDIASCDALVSDSCALIGYPETAPSGCP